MEGATGLVEHYTYVVVGGGIAGVSSVESLAFLDEQSDILLITGSDTVKAASSAVHLTKTVVELNVEEVSSASIANKFSNVRILIDVVTKLDHQDRSIETEKKARITFEKLCICTGGKPNLIESSNPFVVGIRDTESVIEFQKRIRSARRILVVGNGGIASEIIHEVKGVEKIWVIKDNHITKTFIDAGAGEFFRGMLGKEGDDEPSTVIKRTTYVAGKGCRGSGTVASAAMGPDWHKNLDLVGSSKDEKVLIEFGAEVSGLLRGGEDWGVRVELTNKKSYDVDFVVSATGVTPNTEVFVEGNPDLKLGQDGGILVDWKMESTLADVFAAGDVCTAGWEPAPHWHQMRLWTQARQMGMYGAKCMVASRSGEPILQDFCFEIFTHVTRLYGFKVILLGLFNGQKLGDEYELLLRMTKGQEYVKLVLKEGKMQGALLIGETDLEEMCENLILNQLDLTPFGNDLLNPDIDIEDYFD